MKRMLFLLVLGLLSETTYADMATIVVFNAENLFDAADDPDNPGDDSYLPLATKNQNRQQHDLKCNQFYGRAESFLHECKTLDWNDDVYATKLKRLADVINAMAPLPDVIVIPETENRIVLDDLVSRHLPTAGFRVIQLDSSAEPENRGLDVGILTRLDLAENPEAHRIIFDGNAAGCAKTRDIVAVSLRLAGGETLHLFGVHFPSRSIQHACRIRAFETLNELAGALPAGSLAVAAGDFNIDCREVLTNAISNLFVRGRWYASPLVRHGCSAPGSWLLDNKNAWSFLDMILVSAELSPTRPSTKNWFADLGSFGTVVVQSEQVGVDDYGYVRPRWFDPATGRGVSDHWPVAIRLHTRGD
jgi:endonuclease/exonuclease/phosphatase family metal-dependent hydrolase